MAIEYVGGRILNRAGAVSGTASVSLTSSLVGGAHNSPRAGDLVLAIYTVASGGDRALTITDGTNPYTLIGSELYADDIIDTNLRVAYKFMGATPDGSVIFGPTGDVAAAGNISVLVFGGVDPATPLDVAAVTATGANTGRPDPGAITPATSGVMIIVAGAAGVPTSVPVFGSADLTGFNSVTNPATSASVLGVGRKAWTSGAFDPAQFTGGSTSTQASWAAMTLALRPVAAIVPDSATHGHVASQPTLVASMPIAPASAMHSHAATAPSLAVKYSVAPALAAHALNSTQPTLDFTLALSPASARHGHVAGSPALVSNTLDTQDSKHAHTAGSPAITVKYSLVPASGRHAHQAAQPAISPKYSITVNSATHAHTAGSPAIFKTIVTPAGRRFIVPVSRAAGRRFTPPVSRAAGRRFTQEG